MRYAFLLIFLVFSCGSKQSADALKLSQRSELYAPIAYFHTDSDGRLETEYKLTPIDATTYALDYASYSYRPNYATPDTVTQQTYTVSLTSKNGFTAYQSADGLCLVFGLTNGVYYVGDPSSVDAENCPQALDLTKEFVKK